MKRTFSITLAMALTIILTLVFASLKPTQIIRAQSELPPATESGGGIPDAPAVEPPILSDSGQPLAIELPDAAKGGFCELPAQGWQIKSPLTTPVFGNAVVSDGVYVYSAGGNNGSTEINIFNRFDPVTDTWSTLAPLPTAVAEALGVYAEGKIFFFGGLSGGSPTTLIQIYTIATDTWSSGIAMPAARQQMGGGYINGDIYVVGGYSTGDVASAAQQTWAYNIASSLWAIKTDLPAKVAGPGSAVLNGNLYILGGRNASNVVLDTAYRYDPVANTWTPGVAMPVAINYPAAVVYANHIWVIGGGAPFAPTSNVTEPDPAAPKPFNTSYIFSPITGAWSAGPNLNVSRSFMGAAVVRNKIVSVGGYGGSGVSNVVEVANQNPLNILIVYSDVVPPTSLQFQLLAEPGVGRVDLFDTNASALSSSWLFYDYDVIVPFSNPAWPDAVALGNYLAEYLLSGGGVVVGFNFDWSGIGFALAGNWQTGGYSPFNSGGISSFSNGTIGSFLNGHPLLAGVTALNAFYRQTLTPAASASVIAVWNDAKPLIARKGNAVGVSAYVGDINYPTISWSGDFAKIIVNAGYWLRQDNGSCTNLVCTNPTIIQGAITDTDLTQPSRITRADPANTCAAGKTCSVFPPSQALHYDSYPFRNNTPANQCVTVTLDPKTCNTVTNYLQSAAYTSFDPANLCTNYLGDIGASPINGPKSYSFTVPAWQTYIVTVNEVYANAYCPDYTLQVSAGDCPIKKMHLPLIQR